MVWSIGDENGGVGEIKGQERWGRCSFNQGVRQHKVARWQE